MSYSLGAPGRAWDAKEPHWFNEPEPSDEVDIPADDEFPRLPPGQLRFLIDHGRRTDLANLARHAPTHTPEE